MSWDTNVQCLPKDTTMWPSSSVALWVLMLSVASMHLEKGPWRLSIYSMTSTPDLTHWLIHGKTHLFIRQVLMGVCGSAVQVWSSGMPHRSPWSLHRDWSCFTVLIKSIELLQATSLNTSSCKEMYYLTISYMWVTYSDCIHIHLLLPPSHLTLPNKYPPSHFHAFVCFLTRWGYVELPIEAWTTYQ